MRIEDFDHTKMHAEEVTIEAESHSLEAFIVAINRAKELSNIELSKKIPVEFRNNIKEEVHVVGQMVSVYSFFKPLINGECS